MRNGSGGRKRGKEERERERKDEEPPAAASERKPTPQPSPTAPTAASVEPEKEKEKKSEDHRAIEPDYLRVTPEEIKTGEPVIPQKFPPHWERNINSKIEGYERNIKYYSELLESSAYQDPFLTRPGTEIGEEKRKIEKFLSSLSQQREILMKRKEKMKETLEPEEKPLGEPKIISEERKETAEISPEAMKEEIKDLEKELEKEERKQAMGVELPNTRKINQLRTKLRELNAKLRELRGRPEEKPLGEPKIISEERKPTMEREEKPSEEPPHIERREERREEKMKEEKLEEPSVAAVEPRIEPKVEPSEEPKPEEKTKEEKLLIEALEIDRRKGFGSFKDIFGKERIIKALASSNEDSIARLASHIRRNRVSPFEEHLIALEKRADIEPTSERINRFRKIIDEEYSEKKKKKEE